jgi:hypothetical protein
MIMADLFNSAPGMVAVFTGQTVVPGIISISNPLFRPQAALISGIDYTQQTNQQFQPTLDGSLFIYVFGDMMGNVIVHGKIFSALCESKVNGLKEIFDFYAANRASKKPDTIRVKAGGEVIVGFMTRLQVLSNGLSADESGLSTISDYHITINALPKR